MNYLIYFITLSLFCGLIYSKPQNLLTELVQKGDQYGLSATLSSQDEVYSCPDTLEIKASKDDPTIFVLEGMLEFKMNLESRKKKEKTSKREDYDDDGEKNFTETKTKTKVKNSQNRNRNKIVEKESDKYTVSKKKTRIKSKKDRAVIKVNQKDRDSWSEIIKTSHRLKFLKDRHRIIIEKKDESTIELFFKFRDYVNKFSVYINCEYQKKSIEN